MLIKTDMLGNVQWKTIYDEFNAKIINSISQDFNNQYIMAGAKIYRDSDDLDMFVVKLNSLGQVINEYILGSSKHVESLQSVIISPDGCCVATGFKGNPNENSTEILLVKLSE